MIEKGSTVLLGPDLQASGALLVPLALRSDLDVLPYVPTDGWDLGREPASSWAWEVARRGRLYVIASGDAEPEFDRRWLTPYRQAGVPFSIPSERLSLAGPLPGRARFVGTFTVYLLDYNRFN